MIAHAGARRALSAAQVLKQAKMLASLAKADERTLTKELVEENRQHNIRWKAVGKKYEEYLNLTGPALLGTVVSVQVLKIM